MIRFNIIFRGNENDGRGRREKKEAGERCQGFNFERLNSGMFVPRASHNQLRYLRDSTLLD